MAIKRLSTFLKVPRLEPHHQMQFSVIPRTLVGGVGVSPSTEMQLAYSTTLANWAIENCYVFYTLFFM